MIGRCWRRSTNRSASIAAGSAEFSGVDHVDGASFIACTSLFDEQGRFAPTYNKQQRTRIDADTVFVAIGQYAIFAHREEDGVTVTPRQLYQVDPATLQTTQPWIFAAGDAATGPANVVKAIAGRASRRGVDGGIFQRATAHRALATTAAGGTSRARGDPLRLGIMPGGAGRGTTGVRAHPRFRGSEDHAQRCRGAPGGGALHAL